MSLSTIALASGKGGVGKSFLACSLAQLSGWTLLDTDPQCSATAWGDTRDETPLVITTQLLWVATELKRHSQAIIDTPGALIGNLSSAMAAVDLVVIPANDNRFELEALPATLAIAQQCGKPAVVVLNRITPRADVREVIAYITEELSATVCPVVIRERAAHKRALLNGQTAQEAEPDSPAAAEIRDLWAWLQEVG